MMRGLTKNLRRRAAIVIAVAYAFCVLAPATALAVVASPTAFHCIGDLNAKAAPAVQQTAMHVHEDGTSHHHGHSAHDQSGAADHHSDAGDKAHDNKAHGGACCGLFCVSALAHDPGVTFGISTPASSAVATLVNGLTGDAPSPLHRPPKA
jgi:hypothetical protein